MHKKVFNEKCNKTFSDVINAVYFKKKFVKPEDISEVPDGFYPGWQSSSIKKAAGFLLPAALPD